MRRWIQLFVFFGLITASMPADALVAGHDVLVPAAGRGAPWATDLYIYNAGSGTANVTVYWLVRDQANPSPDLITLQLAADETAVLSDTISADFGLDTAGGAFRVVSSQPVIVNSRIFASDGSSTFGQGFEGVPADLATPAGEVAHIVGLSANSTFRTNFYALAGANGATLALSLRGPAGNELATKTITLGAYEPFLRNVTNGRVFGNVTFDEGTLFVTVSAGSAVVGASKVDNASTDPTTLESEVHSCGYEVGPPAPVGKTGQVTCYDGGGSVIPCAGTGQDGEFRPGVGWPSPRFEDNGDGTVTDMLTGLVWLRNANCFGIQTWVDALADANSLAAGMCGLSDGSVAGDWRLPSVNELQSLMDYEYHNPALSNAAGTAQWTEGDTFSGVQLGYYSSSSRASEPQSAWAVFLDHGFVFSYGKTTTPWYVWPVREGQ